MPDQPVPAAEWLRPVSMRGRFVALVPLCPAHAPGLAAGADALTVAFMTHSPHGNTAEDWAAHIQRLNDVPHRVNWAVLGPQGEVLGRISYSEVKASDRWVEIGTMLLPAGQGNFANPEAKLLLMSRAFETLGANRVHFKVDGRNARSLRALEKLGAVREGTLRRYQVRPDGLTPDLVVFSVLTEEWPAVRRRLEERLNR